MKHNNQGMAINSSPASKQGNKQSTSPEVHFDYDHQAWIVDGRYKTCGHTDACSCYGKAHAGELADTRYLSGIDMPDGYTPVYRDSQYPFSDGVVFCSQHTKHSDIVDVYQCSDCRKPSKLA